MTAEDSEIIRAEAFEVGCTAFLPKPFAPMQLMDAIEKALDTPHD
jgi:CheY-like chemotaxis protein